MAKILDGVRILDLSQVGVGPFCTRMFGDFGAEVTKIERPQMGESARSVPPYHKDWSYYFIVMNTNKKSITLNLKSEKGKEIFKELVKKSHVIIENYLPGVMKKLKLSYEEVREVNPEIIYLSMSGFGQHGPYSHFPAYDPIIQAMSGVMDLTGEADGRPLRAGMGLADWLGGSFAAIAILGALLHRKNTGKGQYIDLSMQDCVWQLIAQENFSKYFVKGETPARSGNCVPPFAPVNSYKAKDGYIFISVISNIEWERLLKAMGKEELIKDPILSRASERRKRWDEIDRMVQDWVAERTINEVQDKCLEAGVPSGPVLTFSDLINNPHLKGREMIVDFEQPGVGKIKIPGSPFKFSESPVEFKLPAPSLGEHNEEVYSELLGLSQEEMVRLEKEKVI